MIHRRLSEQIQQLIRSKILVFFAGYFFACILLSITSKIFTFETKVSIIELITLGLSFCAAVAVPLLLKRLTSDADARRSLFLEDVSSLLSLYEYSSTMMHECREKRKSIEDMKKHIRKFTSQSERSLDLLKNEITHLKKYTLPPALNEAIEAYDRLMGDEPFMQGFLITDSFLKKQDEHLHTIKLELRKYQYSIYLQ